jgi:hypothetical protein
MVAVTESPETRELCFGGGIWPYYLESTGRVQTTATLAYEGTVVQPHVRDDLQLPAFKLDHPDNSMQHLSDLTGSMT